MYWYCGNLLDAPAQLLVNTNFKINFNQQISANGNIDALTEMTSEDQNSLKWFECCMVAGADGFVWVCQKLLIWLDLHTQTMIQKRNNYPGRGGSADENALFMLEVRERADWFRQQQLKPKFAECHQWTHTYQNSEQMGCSSMESHQWSLMSADNRKPKQQCTKAQQYWTMRLEKHCLVWWVSIPAAKFRWESE